MLAAEQIRWQTPTVLAQQQHITNFAFKAS